MRGGYGINYDPYPLAFVRNILGNYPSSISLSRPASRTRFQPAGRLADGIPGDCRARHQLRCHRGSAERQRARRLPDEPKRGYIHSWNVTVQGELPWGFTGQVGYVATRQRDINQILDANAGQVIGAGNAGRPLFVRFGRTGATGILSNPGWSDYDSLQTSLARRLSQGVQMNVAYTWSKAFGICCDTLSDNPPMFRRSITSHLNEARLPQDRPHNFQASFVAELPFGPGKPLPEPRWRSPAAVLGGWQVNGLLSLYSGSLFTVTASGTSLDMPGSTQVADQVKDDVAILGGIGPGQPWFDTAAFRAVTERRFGTARPSTACAVRGSPTSTSACSAISDWAADASCSSALEVFNLTNTPHFANPQASVNASNFGIISGTANSGREGIDERLIRVGLRIKF